MRAVCSVYSEKLLIIMKALLFPEVGIGSEVDWVNVDCTAEGFSIRSVKPAGDFYGSGIFHLKI